MTAAVCIIAALAALYLALSYILFRFACRRVRDLSSSMRAMTNATDTALVPYRDVIEAGRAFLGETPHEDICMTSFDGLRLHASLYVHPDARAVMVACHGYRSNGVRDFASASRFYYDHGLSLLIIDERAAGRSEGKYITFGALERHDVRDWCAWAEQRFPGLPVLLAGISMGAASVLMAAPELPESVAAILADCGYASPWDELAYVARHYMTAAALPLLPGVGLWCRLIAHFSLRGHTTEGALRKNTRPVFFVHGMADELVPYENSPRNRTACAAPSELFSVPGADHGLSYLVDTEGYQRAVDAFLDKYVFHAAS